jgi:ParB/RepB/Spo0J family partition protein
VSPEYREIPIDLIDPSPFNTRQNVDEPLEGFSETVAVPLKVRVKPDGRYELVFGHRRLAELRRREIEYAPCIVTDMDDYLVLLEQWAENEDRVDLSDYEKALKLKQMLDTFNVTQTELAKKLGKSPTWITNHLHLQNLKQFFSAEILNQLTAYQGNAILSAPEMLIEQVCDDIEEQYRTEKSLPSATEIQKIIDDHIELNDEDVEKCSHCKHEIEGGVCELNDGDCRFEEATTETDQAQRSTQGSPQHEPGRQEKQPPNHVCEASPGSANCRICGRLLTVPESVKAGIGPVCAKGTKASPEEIYATIQDLYTRFGEPTPQFVTKILEAKGLSYSGAQQALADYKKRPAQPPSPTTATKPTPETTPKEETEQTTCPICGQLDTRQHIDEAVSDFAEYLVTAGVLPLGLAQRVKEALTRIRYGKELKLRIEQEIAIEPEEAEEQEVLAAESEAQAQEESEDREREERELEKEQTDQGHEEEEQ